MNKNQLEQIAGTLIAYLQIEVSFTTIRERFFLIIHSLLLVSLTSMGLIVAPSKTKFVTAGVSAIIVTPSEQTESDASFALLIAITVI